MDAASIFGVGLSVTGAAVRWRWPLAPKWLASAALGAGIVLMVWGSIPWLSAQPGWALVAACLLNAALFSAADCLLIRRYRADPKSAAREIGSFAKIDKVGNLSAEHNYSTAESFIDVGEAESITVKHNIHGKPAKDNLSR